MGRLGGWVGVGGERDLVSIVGTMTIAVFDCTCNTQNSLLLNQHNGDDAPQNHEVLYSVVVYLKNL